MLSKLALQNIRGNKGYFIAYIVTLSVFCTIVYQISNVQIALDEVINQGTQLKEFKLGEVFSYLRNFIYVIIAFFTFYIARFFIKRRTKEIALLKTLGLSRLNIFKVFVIENIVVIVIATILGLIISFLSARLFTFLALSMIGIDIESVSLTLLSKPVIDVCLLMVINFIIISIIPIRTISKVSIAQLLQEDKKPDIANKKPYLSLFLFFVFLGLLIINAVYIMPKWDGGQMETILLYLINASLVAIFLYKGLFIFYFSSYTKQHKGITKPSKIISYAHINQSSTSMYKIMSLISIVTGMIIVLSIFIFGALNTVMTDTNEDYPQYYYNVVVKEQSKKQDVINIMKKANFADVINLTMYPYPQHLLKHSGQLTDGFKERDIILIKASDYHKTFKNAKKTKYLTNVNPNKCHKDKNITDYCHLINAHNITPKVDKKLNNFLAYEKMAIFSANQSGIDYFHAVYLVVDDNNSLLNNIKPETFISYDKPVKSEQVIGYSKLFFNKNTALRNPLNPALINQITVPLIFGSFQLTFFIFAIVLLIALMMSMFFRALESLELSLNDYIIAKRMGLSNKAINTSLLTETFVSQLLPFYFGIICSVILTRQLFTSPSFEHFKFSEALLQPANLTFIIAILIVLHALVIILMMIIKYEINHIKKVK